MRTATGESEPDVTKIRELEERLDKFRIQTSNDLTIRGSAWQGYALNAYTCDELGRGIGPTPTTGACCIDGICSITTEPDCTLMGGTYQGDGTDCDPNPCPTPTGACCDPFNICTVESEADCEAAFGSYLGDGTTCAGVDCTCCPLFTDITMVTFSVSVTGCALGTQTFGPETWTKVFAVPANHEFTAGFGGCAFSASWLNALCGLETTTAVVIIDRGDCTSTDVSDFGVDFASACGPFVLVSGCVTDCNMLGDTICVSTPDFVYIAPGTNIYTLDDGSGVTFTFTITLS